VILGARLSEAKQNCCFIRCRRDGNFGANFMRRAITVSLAVLLYLLLFPLELTRAYAADPAVISTSLKYDSQAERQLLEMANKARAQAGLSALQVDEGLTEAARAHAAVQASREKLSHQLPGEPPLAHRLAANSNLHLDRGGENVAFAPSVDQVQRSLMTSPPHRENLLNPAFNVAGFGVVRHGYVLYVTQDFAQAKPTYSASASEEMVAQAVSRAREQRKLPRLRRLNTDEAQSAACSMAESNSLKTRLSREMKQSRYVLRYTSNQPERLPASAPRVIEDRDVRAFAVGSCYARTSSYPNGVYWMALMFY
jgi:Cysteine-rich secretory protein family